MFRKFSYLIPLLGVVLVYTNWYGIHLRSYVTVKTNYGKIMGFSALSRNGRIYFEFLGIPYAKAPVGALRFEPPQEPRKWQGILNAFKMPNECLQLEVILRKSLSGHEDCLYLNVYTPFQETKSEGKSPLPVLVYIHGGLFHGGSQTTYSGAYFMDQDIVVVTMNYRVGALGFLSSGDEIVRGNNGLRDQNAALKWVKENIKYFGGDPHRVTLMGESAGAASVHYHMVSPKSKGLFHKVIMQSGSAVRQYILTDNPRAQLVNFSEKFNCPTENTTVMVKCLKNVDASTLVSGHIDAVEAIKHKYSLFVPIVEKVHDEKAFLTEEPHKLLNSGKFHKVPTIFGVNSGEGLMYLAAFQGSQSLLSQLDDPARWRDLIPKIMNYDKPKNDLVVAESLRSFYLGGTQPSNIKAFQNLTNMFSDRLVYLPTKMSALLQARHNPVYLYYYNYKAEFSFYDGILNTEPRSIFPFELQLLLYLLKNWLSEAFFGPRKEEAYYGACHADELYLLFRPHMLLDVNKRSRDFPVSQEMVDLWAQFISDKQPLLFQDNVWSRLQKRGGKWDMKYLEISESSNGMIEEPFKNRIDFWNSLNLTFHNQKLNLMNECDLHVN